MPSRINGIGTTYWGQQNVQRVHGICESCHRPGTLSNYETGLWFTIFFIPVIPLGKRQVLNYCAFCTRHRAMRLDEWQAVQTKAIGSAIAGVDADPNSPERAVECHATLSACGQQEEARQYAETLINRFGEDADVQKYLGT